MGVLSTLSALICVRQKPVIGWPIWRYAADPMRPTALLDAGARVRFVIRAVQKNDVIDWTLVRCPDLLQRVRPHLNCWFSVGPHRAFQAPKFGE